VSAQVGHASAPEVRDQGQGTEGNGDAVSHLALVRRGYAEAGAVVRRRAGNFYFAFLGQRAPARRALHAIYAFCREADDAADDGRDPADARQALAALRARLDEIYDGSPAAPRDAALADAVRRFGVQRRDFQALLAGVERDLDPRGYAGFDELFAYCFQVAASVGLLCLPIFGRRDALARRHAVDLGIGMQLVNILRDVSEDAARGRVYIPGADLRRFGLVEVDLLDLACARLSAPAMRHAERSPGGAGGEDAPSVRLDGLVRFEAARARRFLASGLRLLPLLEPRERFCPRMLATIYGEVLDRIERKGAAALANRVSLSGSRKLWLAAAALAEGRRGSRRRDRRLARHDANA
jgi:phytoene synthase